MLKKSISAFFKSRSLCLPGSRCWQQWKRTCVGRRRAFAASGRSPQDCPRGRLLLREKHRHWPTFQRRSRPKTPGPLSTKDCFLFRFLTLQCFTLLKNGQVNFIVQLSKFPSQTSSNTPGTKQASWGAALLKGSSCFSKKVNMWREGSNCPALLKRSS